ncbi:LytR/AlgR family response regulator transcription factor [Parapedobacter koreensis]|uniref:Two component transcriptional regulator, LytTR family n=1 Tax=Parapedobacter koreensis TaxID=332977 RepID=A0A1H7QXI9_9SPHI|nr:LytTR family DNA-binding domain-containing protein [Parapedobacter koreensis]SEL52721.1 two component transcriptional regulator, LytTR family [Parapedobacter koreensis]
MRKPTLLIADKDSDFRKELQRLIKQQGYPAVFWECCNGFEALKYIDALQPNLVLMNVELPGKNGFEVLDAATNTPAVVLLADSPAYAAKAFEYHAVDYLLKPLTAGRVELALRRSELRSVPLVETRDFYALKTSYPTRILVEKGKRLTSITVNQITHLKADKDYTWIHTINGESYLSGNGIGQLERKLNPEYFIRIHRSYIINIDYIQALYRDISKLFVALPNAIEINVGRNYMPAIKELMY